MARCTGLLFAVSLAGVEMVEIVGIDLPFINLLSAILLIISGTFLVGTVVYARILGGRSRPIQPSRPSERPGAASAGRAWPQSQLKR